MERYHICFEFETDGPGGGVPWADEDLEIRAALQDVDRLERLRRLGDGAGVGKHDAAHLEGVSWRSQRAKARRTYPLAVARVLLAFALKEVV